MLPAVGETAPVDYRTIFTRRRGREAPAPDRNRTRAHRFVCQVEPQWNRSWPLRHQLVSPPLGKESTGNLLLDETHRGEPGHCLSMRPEFDLAVRSFSERPRRTPKRRTRNRRSRGGRIPSRLTPARRPNSPTSAWKLRCASALERLLHAVSTMGTERPKSSDGGREPDQTLPAAGGRSAPVPFDTVRRLESPPNLWTPGVG